VFSAVMRPTGAGTLSSTSILPGGDYIIGANSFNLLTTGAYTLTAVAAAIDHERLPASLGRAGRDRGRLADRGRLCRQR